ncbi:MAG: Wzt carbohydrate-binding domain-containing protein, partial [Elainellaceae cyanobacterium]
GCGDGTWLSVFKGHGIEEILGIDGGYVDQAQLQILSDRFTAHDLSQPFTLDRTFDLAVSLEVAEHLPAAIASDFVTALTRLSPVVLFSAAIPHQGGTGHINEQWPDYWVERFRTQGYVAIDALRPQLWDHPDVKPWYAQNCFLFVQGDRRQSYPKLPNSSGAIYLPRAVHPSIYLRHCPEAVAPAIESTPEEAEVVSPALEILGVTLQPADVQSGDGLTIDIAYRVHETVEGAIASLSISDAEGTILLDTETTLQFLPHRPGPHTLQVQIERLELVQGNYFVNPGLFSADWAETYDFHWHRYPLTLQASALHKGRLSPPVRWHSANQPNEENVS